MDYDKIDCLLNLSIEDHPLVLELGGEYSIKKLRSNLRESDKSHEDALRLVCDIYDNACARHIR